MSEACYAQNAEASSSKYIETSCWYLKDARYAQNVEMRIVYVQGQKRSQWTVDSGQFLINYAACPTAL